MSVEEPESGSDSAELLSGYLDYFRAVVIGKLDRLSDTELRHSRLPSGWTPLELLKHLIFMERRWFQWGLMAERVDQPWGDGLERWQVTDDDTLATLTGLLTEVSSRTREILARVDLAAPAAVGGRFERADEAPTGLWICLHVLQEYARHAGHLDIVRELIDGTTGES